MMSDRRALLDRRQLFGAVCVVSCLLFVQTRPVSAQATGTVQGTLTDPAGAGVPGATVTATNQATGVSKHVQSTEGGYYRLVDLLPGTYDLRAELEGFKTVVRTDVPLAAGSVLGLDLSLEMGAVRESVVVRGDGPLVETEVARISEVIPEREVRALPIQSRGVLSLAVISPGIVGKAEQGQFCCDSFSAYAGPAVSSGGAENKSHYSLDGLSLRYTEGSDYGALFSPNADAITEIRVSTNPYQAEFGRVSGPHIQLTTKSGTNAWRGTGHLTAQAKALNADPFFATRELPDSYTRYFGGTIGGPLRKNRLFVFGAYEGLRQRTFGSSTALAETREFAELLQRTRPNSIAAALFKDFTPFRYPSQNFVDLVSPGPGGRWRTVPDGIPDLGEVIDDRSTPRSGNQVNLRGDYHSASGKDRIFGSYWYTRPDEFYPGLREAFESRQFTRANSASVVHTRSFGTSALNEFRLGFMHLLADTRNTNLHVPGIATDDGLRLGNFGWLSWQFIPRNTEISDTFSFYRGRHNVKTGINVRWGKTFATYQTVPEYTFGSLADFANDDPYFEYRSVEIGTGAPARTRFPFVQQELALFVQDNWQATSQLNINYGLRWENFFDVRLGDDRENWHPVLRSDELTPAGVAGTRNQQVNRYYGRDLNNFGPRIGFAWDPTAGRRFAVRGGFGVLYDEVHTQPLFDIGFNPPANGSGSAGPDMGIPIVYGLAPPGTLGYQPNPALTPQFDPNTGSVVGARYGLAGIVSDLETPLVLDGFAGTQYQVASNLMVHVDYKFRRTTNDLYTVDFNRMSGDLVDGLRDRISPNFDAITFLTNRGRSTYHGLIVGGQKRFSQGWSLNASYTYSYGRTNDPHFATWPGRRQQTDPYMPDLEWARDDIPHVFTLHGMWELPFLRGKPGLLASAFGGWQLSTVWNLQSGRTFIPYSANRYGSGGDFNADGFRKDRPDRPTVQLPSSFSNQQWLAGALKASDFPLPDPATPRAGTMPRDLFREPGYARVDLALTKEFALGHDRRVQIRADSFNLLNRLNIRSVVPQLNSANFARATSAYQNRVVQLGLKFLF